MKKTIPTGIVKFEVTGSALLPSSMFPYGTSVTFQSTHRADLHCRLFHFLCPIELAKHNNMYRVCYAPPDEPVRDLLPNSAFSNYVAQLEIPKLDEGFDEVRSVHFVYEGSEEQRKKWDMWMLEVR